MKGLSILIENFEGKIDPNPKIMKQLELESKEMIDSKPLLKLNQSLIDDDSNQRVEIVNKLKKLRSSSPQLDKAKKPINSPKNNENLKKTEEMLEAFYSNVGHDYYTKILKIFEKYCQYGKISSSFGMDYSQFSTFMIQNNLYDHKNLDKTNSELIFNKIKGQNKSKIESFIYHAK